MSDGVRYLTDDDVGRLRRFLHGDSLARDEGERILVRAVVDLIEHGKVQDRRIQRLAKNQRAIIDHVDGVENPPDGINEDE